GNWLISAQELAEDHEKPAGIPIGRSRPAETFWPRFLKRHWNSPGASSAEAIISALTNSRCRELSRELFPCKKFSFVEPAWIQAIREAPGNQQGICRESPWHRRPPLWLCQGQHMGGGRRLNQQSL